MSATNPFAYNTGSTIGGTTQVGSLAVGTTDQNYSGNLGGVPWWMGPDEELGYVIAHPVPSNTQPTPLAITWDPNYVGVGNSLSSGNTAVTNSAVNSSVLATKLLNGTTKIMFSIRVDIAINGSIGFGQIDMDINNYIGGSDGKSIGLSSSGEYLYFGAVQDSGLPTWGAANDIVDVALQLGPSSGMWFRVNGGNWNGTRNENPASGSSSLGVPISDLYPGLTPFPVNIQGKGTILQQPIYPVPVGFTFLGQTFASLGFDRTKDFLDSSFINLAEYVTRKYSTPQTFSSATEASIWLTDNGFWNSYITPVLYLDAGNPLSYPGSGTTWTDLIGGKTFNLINGPTYNSGNGGRIQFTPSSGQYAQCSTSLSSLNTWSVGVWHYYTGQNTGTSPCIVTEIFTGGYINYIIGNGSDTSPDLQTGFWAPGWILTENGYTLTPGNWYYIVGTYDGNTLSLYVNNTLVESTSGLVYTPQSSNSGIFLMSRWDNQPNQLWGGYLSTVGIYDKSLTSTQISSIWNSEKSRYGL